MTPFIPTPTELNAIARGDLREFRRPHGVSLIGANGLLETKHGVVGAFKEAVPSLLVHKGDLWDFRYFCDNPRAVKCPWQVGDRIHADRYHLEVTSIAVDGCEWVVQVKPTP